MVNQSQKKKLKAWVPTFKLSIFQYKAGPLPDTAQKVTTTGTWSLFLQSLYN